MNSSITRPSDTTNTATKRQRTSLRPTAVALRASVAAVRDALEHMDADAVLSVPIGTPGENFDVVEWCVRNDKPVINRFDAWPLDHLIVRNQVRVRPPTTTGRTATTRRTHQRSPPTTRVRRPRRSSRAGTRPCGDAGSPRFVGRRAATSGHRVRSRTRRWSPKRSHTAASAQSDRTALRPAGPEPHGARWAPRPRTTRLPKHRTRRRLRRAAGSA